MVQQLAASDVALLCMPEVFRREVRGTRCCTFDLQSPVVKACYASGCTGVTMHWLPTQQTQEVG